MEVEIDNHCCVRGPVCEIVEECGHSSCMSIAYGWQCRGCETMEPYVFCETHVRYQKLTDQGSNPGFGGTTVYWYELDCGCHEMYESEYTDY